MIHHRQEKPADESSSNGFTEREKMLLSGVDPDELDSSTPSAESVLDEAEQAVRESPIRRERAPRATRPAPAAVEYDDDAPESDDIGVEYADGGEDDGDQPARQRQEESASDWIDDSAIDIGLSYGLTEDQLEQFPSREALDQAIATYNAQRQAPQPGQQTVLPQMQPGLGYAQQQNPWFLGQQAPQQAPPVQQVAPTEQKAETPGIKDGVIDVEYFKKTYAENFDETTANLLAEQLQFIRDQQTELKAIKDDVQLQKRAYLQQQQDKALNEFHDACDSLNPEFFGKSIDARGNAIALDQEKLARRSKLGDAINRWVIPQIVAQQQANGIADPVIPSFHILSRRAMAFAFGNDPSISGTPARRKALIDQGSRRRSPGSGAGNANSRRVTKRESGPQTEESEVQELLSNPAVNAAWDGSQY